MTAHRTFGESLRFPWPKSPVQVVLKKRDRDNSFHELWSTVVDPNSRFVNRADPPKAGTVWTLFESGPPAQKVDILLISEGYTAAQMPKFHADAKRLVDALFAVEPFKSRKSEFNVRGLELPSPQPGVNRPHVGSFRRTPISAEYNIFDSERYVLTLDNRAFRDAAASAPYEFIEILVNEQQYGGGGIFNDQATTSVDTGFAEYVFIHEFGHHFAGLADEYYTSDVAYETGAGNHARAVGAERHRAPRIPSRLKWRDLVEPGTPLPTPWDKAAYETKSREVQARRRELRAKNVPESEIDALFREQMAWDSKFLSSMKYSGKVGAFEGASYEATGTRTAPRPTASCSRATRSASVASAAARSDASSISTPNPEQRTVVHTSLFSLLSSCSRSRFGSGFGVRCSRFPLRVRPHGAPRL